MKRILTLLITLYAGVAIAQAQDEVSRSALLDKAQADTRAAQLALQRAEARRDQGAEPTPGERTGNINGGSRLNDNYFARQKALERQVEAARRRYEQALKRWNDLK